MPDTSQFAPPPAGLVDEDTGETISPRAVPEWDEESRLTAREAATTVMVAFARPEIDHDQWWADLEPLLSDQGRSAYAYVDPANVPASEITGEASVIEETSAYIGRVQIPTNAGTYTVLLSRHEADAPWLAERITPPQEAH